MKQNYGTDTLYLHMKKLLFFCIFKHCLAVKESWKSVVGVLNFFVNKSGNPVV